MVFKVGNSLLKVFKFTSHTIVNHYFCVLNLPNLLISRHDGLQPLLHATNLDPSALDDHQKCESLVPALTS